MAASLNRQQVADLGDAGGKGPRFFIDGSAVMNLERSDACLAWLVPVLPKPKMAVPSDKKKDKNHAPKPTHVFDPACPITISLTNWGRAGVCCTTAH